MMATPMPKNTVTFTPDTDFDNDKRPTDRCWRLHPEYVPGKHCCPADGEWEDTSFMDDLRYRLMHLNIYSILRVRDEEQLEALCTSFETQMAACMELSSGQNIQIEDHPFQEQILDLLAEIVEDSGEDAVIAFKQYVRRSDGLVIYKTTDGEFENAQFICDTYQDQQAKHFLLDLKEKCRPAENVGENRKVVLRRLRHAWLADVCDQ